MQGRAPETTVTLELLVGAPRAVCQPVTGLMFMVSAVETKGGVALALFQRGEPRPNEGAHKLIDADTREVWLGSLRVVDE